MAKTERGKDGDKGPMRKKTIIEEEDGWEDYEPCGKKKKEEIKRKKKNIDVLLFFWHSVFTIPYVEVFPVALQVVRVFYWILVAFLINDNLGNSFSK